MNKLYSYDDVQKVFEKKYQRKLTSEEYDILKFSMTAGRQAEKEKIYQRLGGIIGFYEN